MVQPQTPSPEDVLIVLMTAPDAEVAARIAHSLVNDGLAACVNIVPAARSVYIFEGKVCDGTESLCVIKTRRTLFGRLRDRITALHPYQVPEVIGLAPTEGNAPYLAWVLASTAAA